MKKSDIHPFHFLLTVFAFCVASVIIYSCSKYNDEMSPSPTAKTPKVAHDAYAKLSYDNIGALDCSTLNESALNNKYRAKQ